jgi:hypothetical protein
LDALLRARAEWGVVVDQPGVYPVISDGILQEQAGFSMENATPAVLNLVCERTALGRQRLPDSWRFTDIHLPEV